MMGGGMGKRRKYGIVLAIGLLVICIVLLVLRDYKQPRFDGRPLSGWMAVFADELNGSTSGPGAHALATIGTNAIPYLLKWMRYTPSWRDDLMEAYQHRIPRSLTPAIFEHPAMLRCLCAPEVFAILGPEAKAAIPNLTELMNTPESDTYSEFHSRQASLALSHLGPEAFAPMFAAITNHQGEIRRDIILNLRFLGTNARPAIPLLADYAQSKDIGLAKAAIQTLGALRQDPDSVVPVLNRCISDSRTLVKKAAIQALGMFGPRARQAGSSLLIFLDDHNPGLTEAATNALNAIDPQALQDAAGH